jgi:FxLD family lantipeptide
LRVCWWEQSIQGSNSGLVRLPGDKSRPTRRDSGRETHEGGAVTVQMEWSPTTTTPVAEVETGSPFDLDITLIEVVDPAHLINMTDDGCGNTCEKSTCISAA